MVPAAVRALPLVTVVTPTWQRHDRLLNRCVPSVRSQNYPHVEHIIVSDGPDPELAEKLFPPLRSNGRSRWFVNLPEHDPDQHWGHLARLHGLEYASGEFITYCDDDDALRSRHCELLVNALLEHPEAGWARSLMASHRPASDTEAVTEIGHGEPSCGNLGTPMIMHRRETLAYGTWGPASVTEDWELVNRWLHAGIGYVTVDEITVDVWPSLFYGGQR
jgi:glycosyltransferase involved in cell wall biosynthesis